MLAVARSEVPIAVASRSFSRNPTLRAELTARYEHVRFNDTNRVLVGPEVPAFLRGHTKAITGLEKLDDAVFDAVPELRLVSKYGVGLDMIDLDAARRHGVVVRWTPGVNRQSVAELTIGLIVVLYRRIMPLSRDLQQGRWHQPPGGRQISSSIVGIVGCGHVGKQVARLCRAFGATVLAHDIVSYDEFYRDAGVTPTDLETLLDEADIVSLHVPLDETTRGLIGAAQLARMKPSAIIINTARGGIVDEAALKTALLEQRLAGAGLDVFATEPPLDLELLSLPTVAATPHIGGSTVEAVLAMGRAAINGLEEGPGSIDLTATPKPPLP
jgi:D-3-phosphoglycerate dehydrogenase